VVAGARGFLSFRRATLETGLSSTLTSPLRELRESSGWRWPLMTVVSTAPPLQAEEETMLYGAWKLLLEPRCFFRLL
jgi:hypothetical protein